MNTFLKRILWFIKNIFRKNILKKQIPIGFYCYTIINIECVDGEMTMHVLPCPFYRMFMSDKRFCMLHSLGKQDEILLDDQCKICGINENFEFE